MKNEPSVIWQGGSYRVVRNAKGIHVEEAGGVDSLGHTRWMHVRTVDGGHYSQSMPVALVDALAKGIAERTAARRPKAVEKN